MPPTHLSPSAPPKIGRYLTFPEREDIAIEVAKGTGINAIARKLGRSPSTISRELKRNAANHEVQKRTRLSRHTAVRWAHGMHVYRSTAPVGEDPDEPSKFNILYDEESWNEADANPAQHRFVDNAA